MTSRPVTATTILAAVTLAIAGLAYAGQPAHADGPAGCTNWDPALEACLEWAVPGDPGATAPAEPVDDGNSEAGCHDRAGNQVDCYKDGMAWVPSHGCYASVAPVQPPPGDPVWHGRSPDDGQIWSCVDSGGGSFVFDMWFVPNGEAPTVDAGAVAATLRLSAPYELAAAQIAPPPSYHSYINYVNWLWIPSNQWHDVTASTSMLGATITLTARPEHVTWNLGNGNGTTCSGPGRAWVEGMPENAPTSCSYAYASMQDPEGDTWRVSARITYAVTWTCSGRCGGQNAGELGNFEAQAGEPTSVTVLQRQTVVTK